MSSAISDNYEKTFMEIPPCKIIYDYFLDKKDTKVKLPFLKLKNNLPMIAHNIYENHLLLDHRYMKNVLNQENYRELIDYIFCLIQNILQTYQNFVIHINLQKLTIRDLEKYYPFMSQMSILLKCQLSDKMKVCYIYKPPFLLSQITKFISPFIDKNTQTEVIIIKDKDYA